MSKSPREWFEYGSLQRAGNPPTLRSRIMSKLTHSDYERGDWESLQVLAGFLAEDSNRVRRMATKLVELGYLDESTFRDSGSWYRVTDAGHAEAERVHQIQVDEATG